ncbi:hypothetical protein [Clostridium beijerinckii]|uniref:Uncharacterized protein n=1 Tax=Clostridium beijerinckii TaxID=1520 RepID=A0AAX0BCR8_CLOBE|nr:hypothetical protein [Clostridium beijerinckii]NRT92298.1 hypothetical protein [Clostridium beijerinckii]NYC75559.1 hypothetical protein [Clostridium beijerinckii]
MKGRIQVKPHIVKMVTAEEIKEKNEKFLKDMRDKQFKQSIQENLKDIVRHNTELVSLNNKILNKINSLDDTLLLFNKAFNVSSNKTEEELKVNNALLLELVTIIDSKDDKMLANFIGGMSGTIGVELVISYLKMKLGLTV